MADLEEVPPRREEDEVHTISENQQQSPDAMESRPLASVTQPETRCESNMTTTTFEDVDSVDVPPPAYSEIYGQINLSQSGLKTEARIEDDGRVGITIGEDTSLVSRLLLPTLRKQLRVQLETPKPELPPGYIPPSLGGLAGEGTPPPPMNLVIHVVGSRGDVQPFVALGKVLKETYGHRVRLATHKVFKDFVTDNGLEFFCIGGDPAELMAFMVKNPGLMPGTEALRNGDIRKRRKGMYEIMQGCWRSCFEAGDGTGVPALTGEPIESYDDRNRPFIADAIIANPPSFAHIHCAEKLGIPLHLMFTMPWSPTQAFPHPLANIHKSGSDVSVTNFMTYALVELMTWQGLGDVINRFRETHLQLEPLSMMWGPGLASRLRIPYTYCWSPALIPKPKDWNDHISISGFYFLSLASNYTPDAELAAFLEAGPPPVYIGFGSIVVDDPNALTNLIFEAVKLSGQRALVSKGWGGFGGYDLQVPEGVYMLGNVPHDWLFKHVSCVVHHGGAGTTSAGIALGKPTIVVPFFGDQPFWGAMVARAGAGPEPIPSKQLTAEKLASAIAEALQDATKQRAQDLAEKIAHEKGTDVGAKSFHDALEVDSMRCSLAPSRIAVWQIKRSKVRLSALSVAILAQQQKLDLKDLTLFRGKECDVEDTPLEPIGGAAAALMGTIGSLMMGAADIPLEVFKSFARKSATDVAPETSGDAKSQRSTETEAPSPSTTNLSSVQSPSSASFTTSTTQESLRPESAQSDLSARNKGKSPIRNKPTLEQTVDATRGVGRIVDAGLRSPMDFTMALAKGFRNAPKLYGDETTRPVDRVTGFQSGLKVAGKEFSYGMLDGITGLVTQPMEGAKKQGFSGFMKGFGKGIGGIVLKPGAAIWSLPGYTFKGIYKELRKQAGAGLQTYIIAARTAQGLEDLTHATAEEKQDILTRWEALQPEIDYQRRYWYRDSFKRSLSGRPKSPSAASSTKSKEIGETNLLSTSSQPSYSSNVPTRESQSSEINQEYEEAVRQSVIATSQGNPEEDAEIEKAIRSSLIELQRQQNLDEGDPGIEKAIKASLESYGNQQTRDAGDTGRSGSNQVVPTHDDPNVESDDDENIKKAIQESKEMQRRATDEDDEEFSRALEESRRSHQESELRAQAQEEAIIEYMKKQTLADGGGS